MIDILDKNGRLLESTNKNGLVRRLLKEGKAKIVQYRPFVIQLLNDENNSEDIKMTNDLKKLIVITNSDKRPDTSKFNAKITQQYTFNQFVTLASDQGFEVDEDVGFLIDTDGLTEDLYDMLKPYKEYIKDIYYFKFSTRLSYLNDETIFTLDEEKSESIEKEVKPLCVKLDDNNITMGHILICGQASSGKTTLAKNIGLQFKKNGAEVEYISPIPDTETPFDTVTTCNAKIVAERLETYHKEMMDRFARMQKECVNNAAKLKNRPADKILIIDCLSEYMLSDDYKSVDIIKNIIGSIARLGRAARIILVLVTQRPSGSIVSTSLKDNMQDLIITGAFRSDMSVLMFGEDVESSKTIPLGKAIYRNPMIQSDTSDCYVLFNIDNVATL